jgi:sigma-B regulation protein RsbU (phosphoserine phosphatase)
MKNPFEYLPATILRLYFALFALLVLFVSGINFTDVMVRKVLGNDQCAWIPLDSLGSRLRIEQIVPNGVTDRAGIKEGDILFQLGGKPFQSSGEAQSRINAVTAKDSIDYVVLRNNVMIKARVQILKTFNVAYLAGFLYGLVFLIVGVVVVVIKPQGKAQRMFAYYSLLSMLFFGLATMNQDPRVDPSWKMMILGNSFVIGSIFSAVVFVRFFLLFPVKRKMFDAWWFTLILYSISIASVVLFLVSQLGYLRMILGDSIAQFSLEKRTLLYSLRYSMLIAGLVVFTDSYFRLVKLERKRQLRPILIGVVIGILTFVYAAVMATAYPFAIYLDPVILLPVLLLVVVPFTFGYAIVHYRLMDIDFIVKRSLIYGAVTASMAVVYLVTVYGIGALAATVMGGEESRAMNLLALVVIAFAFDPVKRRTQDWIDRLFYQERHNYQRALIEFSQELPRLTKLEEILGSMVHRVSKTMHIEKVAVLICDDETGCQVVSQGIDKQCCEFKTEHEGLLELLRRSATPQSFALMAEEPESVHLLESDKEKLIRAGVVLAIPMILQDRLIGMINVGPKMSGKVYSKEDIDLFSTVAAQAAIAIENSRLHLSELEKEKIKEELLLARRIQEGLLPKDNPSVKGLDIAGISIPASSVGGDYYDFIQIDPHRLLVVIADVSGKGMSAALYMSKIQGMVQLVAHMYRSPKEMLKNVNRRIFEGIERRSFITMILALFDTKTKKVRICRAGHNKALIATNGKLKFLEGGGIGLGLERGPLFDNELEEVVIPLKKDSLFFFYTDGLTESMNQHGKEFGEETVSKIVKERRSLEASVLQRVVITAAEEFQGGAEQHDDITVVVVRARP